MTLYKEYLYVLIFLMLGVFFVLAALTAGKLLAPSKKASPEKLSTYECGEDTVGTAWIQFNVKYYLIAMLFVIFDVEVAFLLPWAVVFNKLGLFAFIEMFIFLFILAIALIYAWRKGVLEWE